MTEQHDERDDELEEVLDAREAAWAEYYESDEESEESVLMAVIATAFFAPCVCGAKSMEPCDVPGDIPFHRERMEKAMFAGITEEMYIDQLLANGSES